MNNPVVRLENLTRSFEQGGERIDVLRGVDLEIQPGEIVALLGPSGSGKSTMLQAVGLLEGGFGGTIEIAGISASTLPSDGRTTVRREHLGFVYQFHHLLPDFDAQENVILPQLVAGRSRDEAGERARELLGALGLSQRLDHRPSQLSGGEQQRVAVARALANRPTLVLADEPTGNLDEHTADRVLAQFLELVRGEGNAALVATHNERLARKMDRVVRLHDGKLEHAIQTGTRGINRDKEIRMADHPSTFRGESTHVAGGEWNDRASIHKADEESSLFNGANRLRSGTLAEMVAHIMAYPPERRDAFVIEKAGDHRLGRAEIEALAARDDFPD